ncbi:MAG: hypothetical protein WC758_02925 [Candidatus Woesearchaeota archaeon]|jgi:hypothetical protein
MNKSLKPTKKKVIVLFLISFALILISYMLYNFVSIGYTECGSSCSSWLNSIFPFPKMCILVCVPQDIPSALNAPLLQIGSALLIISIIYFLIYYFKYRKI